MKNSFLLYVDRLEVLDEMTDEDAGKLFKAIRDYVKDGSIPERGTLVSIAFRALKPALDSDSEKYHLMCLRRSEAGKKGGRPKKQEKAKKANAFEEKANESKKSKCFSEKAKKADTDTDTDTDTDITSPIVEVISAGARVDVGDSGVKLPISQTESVDIDGYFLAQLHEMYPDIDIHEESARIGMKLIASGYPCQTQPQAQKYMLEWFKRVAIDKTAKSHGLDESERQRLNAKILHFSPEDI